MRQLRVHGDRPWVGVAGLQSYSVRWGLLLLVLLSWLMYCES